jgi:hypothetical protein
MTSARSRCPFPVPPRSSGIRRPDTRWRARDFCGFGLGPRAASLSFVSDLGEKEALLTGNPDAFFTSPHYDGYPVVLVNLDNIDHDELRELITDSWLIKAPPKLRRQLDIQ